MKDSTRGSSRSLVYLFLYFESFAAGRAGRRSGRGHVTYSKTSYKVGLSGAGWKVDTLLSHTLLFVVTGSLPEAVTFLSCCIHGGLSGVCSTPLVGKPARQKKWLVLPSPGRASQGEDPGSLSGLAAPEEIH